MANKTKKIWRITTNKKILISAIVLLSLTLSMAGLRYVSAMVQPVYNDANRDEKLTKMTDQDVIKSVKAEEAAKTEAKVVEQKQQEAATKEAAKSAAASKAKQAEKQAQSQDASVSVSPAPKAKSLYVDSASKIGQPAEIGSQSTSVWLGNWNGSERQNVNSIVTRAVSQGAIASLVMYYIPNRDCGDWSQGGAANSAAYRAWVREVAAGIGNREVIVIVEPDALGHDKCLTDDRYADISYAVSTLVAQTRASVYLDAGNSSWQSAGTMVTRLAKANIAQARGFAMNVSGYETTQSTIRYGEQISSKNGKSYVIDTSRNGQGPNGEWCNPRGRGLGKRPAIVLSGKLDAYLWVKVPGESDGGCNGGPSAGTWWPDYAQELIRNAVY
jgi:cellulase/cellobiase CelA1